MGGGLMQLVAYGAQDIYLTGNPQVTYFKIIYRRHTNFSLESVEQTFNGSADFGKKVTCTISRNGDLIHKTYLQVVLPDVIVPVSHAPAAGGGLGFRWLNWIGHALVKSVEIEIGGQKIDKHYAAWLHIWNELTQSAGHALGYANMVGNTPDLTSITSVTQGVDTVDKVVKGQTLYIPLQFWFCRNAGLALPLIALQYHEIKINLDISPVTDLYWCGTRVSAAAAWDTNTPSNVVVPSLSYCSLWVDYVYLDTEERRRYAKVSHEYLIEQLQFTGDESTSNNSYKVKLNFNHPCKELVWVCAPDDMTSDSAPAKFAGKQWFNFTDNYDNTTNLAWMMANAGAPGGANLIGQNAVYGAGQNPVLRAKIQLNGHDRFSEREGRYFNLVQPYQHHTNIPAKGINVYSFALLPEEHQPSGSCNMSRIDNATLQLALTDASVKVPVGSAWPGLSDGSTRNAKIKVFAINYNVLRIMSGMGGLSFAN
jgi:hypothetical protein